MSLMSEALQEALVNQWAHEIYNSHIYIYVAAYLKNMGFDNVAKIFEKQYEEEQGHAKMIVSLLTDLNTQFVAPQIASCEQVFSNIVEVADIYLGREILTTESLDEIKKMAIDESNPVVEERIREMILLQQNEYEESTTFKDKADIIGRDMTALLLWDASLGG